jgi:hypothetical protein
MLINQGVAMSGFHQSVVVTAFVLGLGLLLQFNQEIALPNWLAPFGLDRLLSVMNRVFPAIQRGSWLAFVVGYLLIGVLMFNMMVLFTIAHLPGKLVALSSPLSAKAGLVMLGLLGTGLFLLLKALFNGLAWVIVELKAAYHHAKTSGDSMPRYLKGAIS